MWKLWWSRQEKDTRDAGKHWLVKKATISVEKACFWTCARWLHHPSVHSAQYLLKHIILLIIYLLSLLSSWVYCMSREGKQNEWSVWSTSFMRSTWGNWGCFSFPQRYSVSNTGLWGVPEPITGVEGRGKDGVKCFCFVTSCLWGDQHHHVMALWSSFCFWTYPKKPFLWPL